MGWPWISRMSFTSIIAIIVHGGFDGFVGS